MHYYSHNIDDFNAATIHLTRVEQSLYRCAIELYYKTESPLNSDLKSLRRRLIARSDEEIQALDNVLEEFFYLTDDGYVNDKCEENLQDYRNTVSEKSIAGQISAATRKINKLDREYTKKIKDLISNKDANGAKQMMHECLTGVEQVLNRCSTEVQQSFNKKATESQLTNKLNNLITNNKKNKQKKEPPTAEFDFEKRFEEFYELYPKGAEKIKCLPKFKKVCPDEIVFEKLMSGLKAQINNNWLGREKQYIPAPLVWLNGQRWTDDIIPPASPKNPTSKDLDIASQDFNMPEGLL